jgi:hypothetical protein
MVIPTQDYTRFRAYTWAELCQIVRSQYGHYATTIERMKAIRGVPVPPADEVKQAIRTMLEGVLSAENEPRPWMTDLASTFVS